MKVTLAFEFRGHQAWLEPVLDHIWLQFSPTSFLALSTSGEAPELSDTCFQFSEIIYLPPFHKGRIGEAASSLFQSLLLMRFLFLL